MRYAILAVLVFLSSIVKADDCQTQKRYDDTHQYLGCRITSVTPSYRSNVFFPADKISELKCFNFCEQNTLIPVSFTDPIYPVPVSRRLVNLILDAGEPAPHYQRPEMWVKNEIEKILESDEEELSEELRSYYREIMDYFK